MHLSFLRAPCFPLCTVALLPMATTGSPNGQQHLLDDMSSDAPRTTYSIVPSFFLQDDPATDPITFEYVGQNPNINMTCVR